MTVIETHELTKIYGTKTGCRDVSLTCRKGEIFGFLGPNGAGKSTLVKMLTGLLFPTSGEAEILGRPLGDVAVRQRMGYLPENFKYQDWMTGEDLLSFHASLFKLDKETKKIRMGEALEIAGLRGSEKYRIGTYSKGMQQRIGIATSLLCDPQVLFLDEPTSALDPLGRKEVRDLLLRLKDDGKTIFFNSHLLGEVEAICDSIAIIKDGNILRQGSMESIMKGKTVLHISASHLTPEVLAKLKGFDPNPDIQEGHVELHITDRESIPSINRVLVENGCSVYELVSRRESLEHLFINIVRGEPQ
ncbi:MAG: ABC transporter ATP-binding protein [Ruminiclostridium sp.]|nr:ABC transporter ATP-binding protein [Ruminiclostridium sp.]